MSQSGYTPIKLYYSTTASATPSAGNLANGELAINILDEKLYFKNNAGTVKLLASSSAAATTFSAGTTGFTPNTATSGAVTLAGTLGTANGGTNLTSFTSGGALYATSTSALTTGTLPAASGGTGQASYTAGDFLYASGATALSKLGIGTAGQVLTSTGTAPQWSTLSGVAVTTINFGTTGLTPAVATSGAVTVAGTLATANGGTNLTTLLPQIMQFIQPHHQH
jgi:hypothetical protein